MLSFKEKYKRVSKKAKYQNKYRPEASGFYHTQKLEKIGWRSWLHLCYSLITLGWEIHFWSNHFIISLELDEEDTRFIFAIPPIFLSVHLELNWFYWNKDKEISLKIHHGAIWWCLWKDDNEWSNKTPRWRQGSFDLFDLLLGDYKYLEKIIDTIDNVIIPLPEGNYRAKIKFFESSWKRKRWPLIKKINRVTIDIPGGIPIEGKGENSWDCGIDHIFSFTTTGETKEEAISKIIKNVLDTRRKYGTRPEWQSKTTIN